MAIPPHSMGVYQQKGYLFKEFVRATVQALLYGWQQAFLSSKCFITMAMSPCSDAQLANNLLISLVKSMLTIVIYSSSFQKQMQLVKPLWSSKIISVSAKAESGLPVAPLCCGNVPGVFSPTTTKGHGGSCTLPLPCQWSC